MMDCACCGLAIGRSDNTYAEDDEFTCPECGATNTVFVDEEDGAYFGAWRCTHGESGEEPCDQCEIESGVAV